jgi:hypothetical protein
MIVAERDRCMKITIGAKSFDGFFTKQKSKQGTNSAGTRIAPSE